MTAPISLREYMAAVGSPFTKADAEVIGPQITALAEEEGEVDERRLVDVATSSNSPLHRYFEWDNDVAADKYRLGQAGTMLRSIRVKVLDDGRPRVAPAYKVTHTAPKLNLPRAHNVLHGQAEMAVHKAKVALDELIGWRARYQPFVSVWADFSRVFRGVVNQISEAEDTISISALDGRTDAALMELEDIAGQLAVWRERHGSVADTWEAIAEQAGFLGEAINDAVLICKAQDRSKMRVCLRCSAEFLSAGPENRICKRCG